MSSTTNAIPTSDELLDQARGLVPVVRERAVACEELRRLPDETVADFKAAGFARVTRPTRFDGWGYDLRLTTELAMEVARGCGSSGWLASFYAAHNFQIAWFDEQAQVEYWASAAEPLAASASAVVSLERNEVDGGLRLSGRYKFSSGVDFVDWLLVQTSKELCLVPRSDVELDDDWFVSGLRGTGSKSIILDDVFIPAHRFMPNATLGAFDTYAARHESSPFYRVDRLLYGPTAILAPLIGMAQGVLDVFEQRVQQRRDPLTLEPAHQRPGPQSRFAESATEVEIARMLLRKTLSDAADIGCGSEPPSLEYRAYNRKTISYAAKLSIRAVDRLVESGDSSALYEVNSLHRLARDARAAALQFILAWDEYAADYSRVRWGLEPQTKFM